MPESRSLREIDMLIIEECKTKECMRFFVKERHCYVQLAIHFQHSLEFDCMDVKEHEYLWQHRSAMSSKNKLFMFLDASKSAPNVFQT